MHWPAALRDRPMLAMRAMAFGSAETAAGLAEAAEATKNSSQCR